MRCLMSQRATPPAMMQPMFPEGDWNCARANRGPALVVAPPAVDVGAAAVAVVVELDVVTDDPVAGPVTVTVLDDPPHPASATASAATTPGRPLFTKSSLADTPEGVGSMYEHDHHSRRASDS